ncbi:MetQ/NlpA family ABC transporter substrate-binding protein [Desulfovibrio sp. OttesenSCG-928-C14]|nr:MetQ/NlpA family ABC transporter substrate-binding protein [Desulfovibrio sp. OttesenSCG-928-C14]
MIKKILLLLCLALLCASCSGESEKQGRAALVLGVMPSMDYLPLAVAQREGYFKEAGLELELIRFHSANERDAAFQSGNIDGTVIDYTGAVLQKSGGLDLKLASRCDAPFYLLGRPGGPRGAEELKGARLAVSRNTVIDYLADMALQSAGLESGDVEKVEINKIPLRFEMLMAGKIDGTGLPDPLALIAQNQGANLLCTNRDLGLAITGIMFSAQAVRDKKDQIRKMYAAYNRGVEYLRSHGPEEIKDILIGQMNFREELIPLAVLPEYGPAAQPSLEDLQSVSAWLAGRNLVPVDFAVETLLDGSLLP